jgi:hypothetical protein
MILKLFILFIFFVLIYSSEKFSNLFDPRLPDTFSVPPDIVRDKLIKVNPSYSCSPNTILNEKNLCVAQIVPKCIKSATVIEGECFFTDKTTDFICPKNYILADNNTCLHKYSSNITNSFCPDGYRVVNDICTQIAGIPSCTNDNCNPGYPVIPSTFYNCPPNMKELGGICQ